MNEKDKINFLAVLASDIMGASAQLTRELQHGDVPENIDRLQRAFNIFTNNYEKLRDEQND